MGCLSWSRPPRKTSKSGSSLGTVWGKAVTKEQRPRTAPCLADIRILEGLWLLFGEGLLEDEGERDLDDDGDVEEEEEEEEGRQVNAIY